MDKKKLLGTIIGVIMFAMLIVGATYAWLTLTANVTNGTYAGNSLNFTFSYSGNDITAIKMYGPTPARNSFTAGSGYSVISASKAAGTAKASAFNIKLHKTSATITDFSVIRYVVCRNATASNCNNSVSTALPSSASGNFVARNQLSSSTDITLYTDTTTFNVEGAASMTYYVYLWIDGELITTSNQDKVVGKSFSGYLYADATQGD